MEEKVFTAVNLHLSVRIGIKLQMDFGCLRDDKRKKEGESTLQHLNQAFQEIVRHFPTAIQFALERMPEIYAEQVTAATVIFPPPVKPYPPTCPYTLEELMDEGIL